MNFFENEISNEKNFFSTFLDCIIYIYIYILEHCETNINYRQSKNYYVSYFPRTKYKYTITILSNYESLTFLPITSIIRLIFLSRELNKYKQNL